MLGGTDATLPT